jgi:sirohydrochlorin cobaltochelatase
MEKTNIVLVMHGVPPKDYPAREIAEFMTLHSRLEHGGFPPHERAAAEARFAEMDGRIRSWPRSAENDAFYVASLRLADELSKATGNAVELGFNEFCAPAVPAALDRAAEGAARVMVITPMLTPGGEHAEVEIPQQVEEARRRHPGVEFAYVWPYEMADVAAFLAERIRGFAG